jgi:putative spermidine/putrescine transport system permease protein
MENAPAPATSSIVANERRGMDPALVVGLRRVERRRTVRALVLMLPALVFVGSFFLVPVVLVLVRSVENGEVARVLPETAAAIARWDGRGVPDATIQAALVRDLRRGVAEQTLGTVGRRLNREITGFLTLIQTTGRKVAAAPVAPGGEAEALTLTDARWGEPRYWAVIRRNAGRLTDFYFLSALDLERGADGAVAAVPADRALYVDMLLRSLWISLGVTLLCLAAGYPMSFAITSLRPGTASLALTLVLLPFWTSALVRTTAWIVLLEREGLVNGALLALGLIAAPLPLIFNRFGVMVALTHVLLPYMILTLFAVMRGVDTDLVRAARSLGASPWQAFRRVYLPQTMPGVAAGSLLVFILAIGSYVTPALVGGRHDQMISYFIAFNINQSVNWGLAASLSSLLLATVVALYVLYGRLVGIDRLRAG